MDSRAIQLLPAGHTHKQPSTWAVGQGSHLAELKPQLLKANHLKESKACKVTSIERNYLTPILLCKENSMQYPYHVNTGRN